MSSKHYARHDVKVNERGWILEYECLFTFHCIKFMCFLLPHEIYSSNVPFPQHFNFEETRWSDFDLILYDQSS